MWKYPHDEERNIVMDVFDQLAKKIADRFRSITTEAIGDCKEAADEEVNEFFDSLLEAKERKVRKMKRGPYKKKEKKPTIKSRKESKVERMIHILNTGPVLKKDLMRDLDFKTDAALHSAVFVAKKMLKKQKKTIIFEKGNKDKGSIYAIRDK